MAVFTWEEPMPWMEEEKRKNRPQYTDKWLPVSREEFKRMAEESYTSFENMSCNSVLIRVR